jgi:nitrate/nitrite-specific signal transduction histidine kinase
VVSDLIVFCDAVERLLSEWHDETRLRGKDLQELRQAVNKLHADIDELVQVIERWNSHKGDNGVH